MYESAYMHLQISFRISSSLHDDITMPYGISGVFGPGGPDLDMGSNQLIDNPVVTSQATPADNRNLVLIGAKPCRPRPAWPINCIVAVPQTTTAHPEAERRCSWMFRSYPLLLAFSIDLSSAVL